MDNPTGKYFLDLANTYERAIVMQLIGSSKHRNMKWKGPQRGDTINGNQLVKILENMHKGR